MKNVWPKEVQHLLSVAIQGKSLDEQNTEKLNAHINRLWLADTPESTIIYEVSTLAEAMESRPCVN